MALIDISFENLSIDEDCKEELMSIVNRAESELINAVSSIEEAKSHLREFIKAPKCDFSYVKEIYDEFSDLFSEVTYKEWDAESSKLHTSFIRDLADLSFKGKVEYIDLVDIYSLSIFLCTEAIGNKNARYLNISQASALMVYASSIRNFYQLKLYFEHQYDSDISGILGEYTQLFGYFECSEEATQLSLGSNNDSDLINTIESSWDRIDSIMEKKMNTHLLIELWNRCGKSAFTYWMIKKQNF